MSLLNVHWQEKRMLFRQPPKLLQQNRCTTFFLFFFVLLNVHSLPDSIFWRQQFTTHVASLLAFSNVFFCVCVWVKLIYKWLACKLSLMLTVCFNSLGQGVRIILLTAFEMKVTLSHSTEMYLFHLPATIRFFGEEYYFLSLQWFYILTEGIHCLNIDILI